MITYKVATSREELRQILDLQKANLAAVISSEEKEKEGFVTVEHTFEILKAMNDMCPHIIAVVNNTVVGYALCMHPKFADTIEVLRPMFNEILVAIEVNVSWIVMGQICIDKEYRQQGIFRNLYKTMLEEITPRFSTIITEVDASNSRSINAHYGIGFRKLSTYKADGRLWELIYLK
tara:strand:- start:4248 stop:4778 length:531 start_codon:yes stop_codon:yes gene_type:complete